MNNFDIKIAIEWVAALVVSVGGSGVIIVAIAKWFGSRLANKLLEKDKAKYQKELEDIKSVYQQTLEEKKLELEKQKTMFLRYSEHQFTLYNDLWKSLCALKHTAEELWEIAEPTKLKNFSKQLRDTKLTVEKSALLIEDRHYVNLVALLNQFGKFEFGKLTLITLRNSCDLELNGVTIDAIKRVINQNGQTKTRFIEMVDELSNSFKRQIRGE